MLKYNIDWGIWEQGTEENMKNEEGWNNRMLEKTA
jgi:hypothetical protein